MLLLRSALALVGAAYLIGKFVTQRAENRRAKSHRHEGHVFTLLDEMPLYGEPPAPFPLDDYRAAKERADAAMGEYIQSHQVTPQALQKAGTTGMAVVAFVVEPDGTVTHPHVIRDTGHSTAKAALGVVSRMAAEGQSWRPGYRDGEAVRSRYTVTVHFG